LPRIAERVPEVKLTIVGKDPVPEVRRLAGERVIVTGFVDDVRPYIDRASIFVCPMRKGAGIKNKLLQAWAMAKPVVSTSIALGGLYAKPGENILVADTPAEFSEAVIRLLKNSVLRQALGGAGLKIIRGHYTWDRQGRLLEAALRAL
jgi:glycosyltransferase involved in cell wall biosynthesis